MLKQLRMIAALMTLALLMALVPASFAQDEMTFGLSQDDFGAFTQANAASAAAGSAAYEFVLTGDVSGETGGSINLNGSGVYGMDADGSPLFQLKVGGSIVAQGQEMPVDLELRVTGGVLYFSGADITGGQWQGMTLDEATSSFTEGFNSSLPFDLESLASGDASGMGEEMSTALAGLMTVDPQRFITITRTGDQFTTSFDIAGFASSPEFTDFLVAAAASQGDGSGMSEGEMAGMAAMAGTLFQNTSLSFDQYVTDGMVSRAVLALSANIDPAMIGQTGEAVSANLNFDISLSAYGETPVVEVPADAMMLSSGS